MFDQQQKLDVTRDELAVITAALETQAKILNVQASAGGSGARRRLNEVKKVIATLDSQRETPDAPKRRSGFAWFGLARTAS